MAGNLVVIVAMSTKAGLRERPSGAILVVSFEKMRPEEAIATTAEPHGPRNGGWSLGGHGRRGHDDALLG
jgi:hypothetical protein